MKKASDTKGFRPLALAFSFAENAPKTGENSTLIQLALKMSVFSVPERVEFHACFRKISPRISALLLSASSMMWAYMSDVVDT